MRKFDVACTDVLTGMELVLSDASYNNACSYLSKLGVVESCQRERTLEMTKIRMACGMSFFYDEKRGVLLKAY